MQSEPPDAGKTLGQGADIGERAARAIKQRVVMKVLAGGHRGDDASDEVRES